MGSYSLSRMTLHSPLRNREVLLSYTTLNMGERSCGTGCNEILNLSVAERLIIDIARERRILTTVTAAWIALQFQLGKARLQGLVIEHPPDQRFADPKQEFNSLHSLQ